MAAHHPTYNGKSKQELANEAFRLHGLTTTKEQVNAHFARNGCQTPCCDPTFYNAKRVLEGKPTYEQMRHGNHTPNAQPSTIEETMRAKVNVSQRIRELFAQHGTDTETNDIVQLLNREGLKCDKKTIRNMRSVVREQQKPRPQVSAASRTTPALVENCKRIRQLCQQLPGGTKTVKMFLDEVSAVGFNEFTETFELLLSLQVESGTPSVMAG